MTDIKPLTVDDLYKAISEARKLHKHFRAEVTLSAMIRGDNRMVRNDIESVRIEIDNRAVRFDNIAHFEPGYSELIQCIIDWLADPEFRPVGATWFEVR